MFVDVAGKFERVSAFQGSWKEGPIVVGFIGNLTKRTIAPESIEYIKGYYNRAGWNHRFVDEFPKEMEIRNGFAIGNITNGFMVIEK